MPQLAHCSASMASWSHDAANRAHVFGPLAVYSPDFSPRLWMYWATGGKPSGNLSGLAIWLPPGVRLASIQQSEETRRGAEEERGAYQTLDRIK